MTTAIEHYLDAAAVQDAKTEHAIATGNYASHDCPSNHERWLKSIEDLAQAEHQLKQGWK